MPRARVVFYRNRKGNVPVLEWLDTLSAKIQDKCVVKTGRLRELGHELRRPEADFSRDGIYELRIGREEINDRILYFFRGRMAAVLAHGIIKEREVPRNDIERTLERKHLFEEEPRHIPIGRNDHGKT